MEREGNGEGVVGCIPPCLHLTYELLDESVQCCSPRKSGAAAEDDGTCICLHCAFCDRECRERGAKSRQADDEVDASE